MRKSVSSPSTSPNGQWIAYTVSSRVEHDNSTEVTWVVRSNGSGSPNSLRQRASTYRLRPGSETGSEFDAEGTYWLIDQNRLTATPILYPEKEEHGVLSPDGRWRAVVREIARPAQPTPDLSDFEQRHTDRFKGVQFDWYPFVRDGQDFPIPNRSAANTTEIFLEREDDSAEPIQLTDLGLGPTMFRGVRTAAQSSLLRTRMPSVNCFTPAQTCSQSIYPENSHA